MYQTGLS